MNAAHPQKSPVTSVAVMDDGAQLPCDVYLPPNVPAPILLIRTPYDRKRYMTGEQHGPALQAFLAAGFGVVIQDCRGTGEATGVFEPLINEERDGLQTLDWVSDQEWCTGRIATYGDSYLGFTQFAMAVSGHPALRGCIPINTAGNTYASWIYSKGGALSVENTDRYGHMVAIGTHFRAGNEDRANHIAAHMDANPLTLRQPRARAAALAQDVPWFAEFLANPDYNEYWKDRSYSDRFSSVTAPCIHIGGWYDFFSDATAEDFAKLRTTAATPEARAGQYLVLGPWTHISTTGIYPDVDLGPDASAAALELARIQLMFLNAVLSGETVAINARPRVSYFAMGINEWRYAEDWPLPSSSDLHLFLSKSKQLHPTSDSNQLPDAVELIADPSNPVPTRGGRLLSNGDTWSEAGPTDQRPVEQRKDVLTFTSKVLDEPLEVTGHSSIKMFVQTLAASADIAVTLTDVYPDGRSILLTEGLTRFVSTEEHPDQDQVHEVVVDLSITSNVFLPGHQIRVNIASSNFPRYELNATTFESQQPPLKILLGGLHATHLTLPTIDRNHHH